MDREGAIICPRCRKLINADEPKCPYCGVSRPGAAWRQQLRGFDPLGHDQVVRSIIYLNVAMYLLSLLFSRGAIGTSPSLFSFLSPSDTSLLLLGATGTVPVAGLGRWWTLLSANYLHAGLLHIFFNMVALYQLGPMVVREYGPHRTLGIYTLGGVAGFAVSYLAGVRFTIGASAAVCSLIGAMLYYGWGRGGSYGQMILRHVWGWAVAIFVFGFLVSGINNWAHGGGMAAGFLVAAALGYQERRRETAVHRALGWGCLVSTVAVLLWAVVSSALYSMGR